MFERMTLRFPKPTADNCTGPPSTSVSCSVSDHALEPGTIVVEDDGAVDLAVPDRDVRRLDDETAVDGLAVDHRVRSRDAARAAVVGELRSGGTPVLFGPGQHVPVPSGPPGTCFDAAVAGGRRDRRRECRDPRVGRRRAGSGGRRRRRGRDPSAPTAPTSSNDQRRLASIVQTAVRRHVSSTASEATYLAAGGGTLLPGGSRGTRRWSGAAPCSPALGPRPIVD